MNLNKLKRLLREVLIRSCNTDQIAYIAREADPNFNLKEVSGFGEHVVIPKQVAADTVIDYFESEYQILNFIATLYYYEGKGISGGVVTLRDKHKLDKYLEENHIIYNPELNKFVVSQKDIKKKDWGILEEGMESKLAFMELDIISSSELIKTNVKIDVENTLRNFRLFITEIVESFNGRIWQWFGDGGLIAFLNESGVSNAIRSGLKVLYSLPIFNLTANQLRWENNVSLRMAIHFGFATYKEDINMIDSEDIKITKILEHELGLPNSIIISETALNLCDNELKKFFEYYNNYKNINIYKLK
ncbi:MAG: hypothetical protein KatS3mg129_3281 [Leptospiraceae bacterium]|nr:MAG: hypothetical protein KatS3mg129_0702 [Leptospiraceae bacterium]GIX43548.1 MAG: hypothetical protein KatS3mg129_3281 [Leptospiraceae bacterium]